MKTLNTKHTIAKIILLIILTTLCTACSDDDTATPPPNYDGYGGIELSYTTLSRSSSDLKVQLIETIIYDQSGNQTYYEEWSYSDFLSAISDSENETINLTDIPAGPNQTLTVLGKNGAVLISYASESGLSIAASQTFQSVHLEAQAFIPSVTHPVNAVYTTDTLHSSFSWDPVDGAEQYRVTLKKIEGYTQSTVMIDETVNTNSCSALPVKTHEIFSSAGEVEMGTPVPFPDTGQTTFYNETQVITVAPSSGQDFYGQDAHYQKAAGSYTAIEFDDTNPFKTENNSLYFTLSVQAIDQSGSKGQTITIPFYIIWRATLDQTTGLMWEIKTLDDNSGHERDKLYTWEEAQEFINQLNTDSFCGYQDWRLPTINELNTLLYPISSREGGLISTAFFPNNTYQRYFTSSTLANYSTQFENPISAWTLLFINGWIEDKNFSTANMRIRVVRGSQITPTFIDNEDGTITDSSSDLMWSTEINGPMTWKEALAYCQNMTKAGHNDWRLPNKNELLSIVDYTRLYPTDAAAVDPIFSESADPELLRLQYWTSTTYFTNPENAYTIDFSNGACFSNNKIFAENIMVRAVRNQQ